MANAPERAEALTTAATGESQPGGITAAVPPAPLGAEAVEPYRAMSGLAMAGFALAVLFAATVLVGGVMAVYARRPRLLLTLLVLAPLGGVLAALLAQTAYG